MTLIYAGQEVEATHLPSLFEKDTVMWQTGADISWLLARLSQIKKAPLFTDSRYEVTAMPHDIMLASHYKDGQQMLGVFSLRGKSSLLQLNAPRWVLSKSDQRPKS